MSRTASIIRLVAGIPGHSADGFRPAQIGTFDPLQDRYPTGGLVAMADHTAVGVRVALDTGFHAARARLRILAKGETLPRACEVAYGEGISGLAELAGPAAGLTRLAGVCLEDLTETDDCAHIALEWEAIAADGKLFTALLADLMLIPAGDQTTALSVTGTYWPPPGRGGAGLGQAIVRHCATMVTGIFLDSVACELVHPAGTAGPLAGRRYRSKRSSRTCARAV
jgi:hypothetical protein